MYFTLHPTHTHTLTPLHLEVHHPDHSWCIVKIHSTPSELDRRSGHGREGRGSGRCRRFVRECKLLDDTRSFVMHHCTPSGLGGCVGHGHGHGCSGSGRGRHVGIHSRVMDRIPIENFLYIVFEIWKFSQRKWFNSWIFSQPKWIKFFIVSQLYIQSTGRNRFL